MSGENDLRKVKARLRALNEKTVENGCTEDEAIAAANKKAELLSRHGLTEDDLSGHAFVFAIRHVGKRRPIEEVWFVTAIFADCKGWYTTTADGLHITFFGRECDVVIAEYVHDVLAGACDRAIRDFRRSDFYRKRRTPKTKRQALKAFEEGLARSIVRKLVDGLWKRLGDDFDRKRRETQALLESKARDSGFRLKSNMWTLSKATGAFRDGARSEGFQAGAGIDVNAPVGSRPGDVVGLLR